MSGRRQVVSAGAPQRRRGGPWGLWDLVPLDAQEVEALLGLARSFCTDSAFRLDAGCRRDVWLRYVLGHGLTGVLGGLALAGKVEEATLAAEGRAHYFTNLLRHEQALRLCHTLRDEAERQGVRISLLKGPSLAAEVYGDGGLRGYADIDVLMASESAARRFADALARGGGASAGSESVMHRLAHPGKVAASVGNWEVEIAFPWGQPSGPLAEMQEKDADRLLPPGDRGALPGPEATAYLLLLIEHLVRHVGERLIWFVDLVLFVRRHADELDWAWLRRRTDDLGLSGVAALVGRLCRERLDPAFPLQLEAQAPRAEAFCVALFSPGCVATGFRGSARRHGRWISFWAMCLQRAGRNWVVTDQAVRHTHAARWLAALVLNALGWRGRLVSRTVLVLFDLLGRHGSRLAIWTVERSGCLDTHARPG